MGDPTDILNWRRLDARLTTSGQPTEAQLSDLRDLGVRHVVNLGLHTHEKALTDEAGAVAALGMAYTHIPVDFEQPTEADYEAFCAALAKRPDEPTHVHCIFNARVSAFFYRYRRERLGVPEAEARARMESVWRPGGVWARFIGDAAREGAPHELAGRDY